MLLPQKKKVIKVGGGEFLEAMDKFMALTVVMVSWVYTYL